MTRNYANWKFRIVWTFLTTVCCTSLSDAQCSETSSGIKRFGPDCRHACYCMSKEQCDSSTGDCTSGCGFEWTGPGCQYKCDDGWYGNNCTGQCNPECTDKSSCRKSDGFCVTVDFTTPAPTATSAAFTVRLIAGVGAAIVAIIVMCAIAIFCYLKQTRNSTASNSRNIVEMGVKFSDVSEGAKGGIHSDVSEGGKGGIHSDVSEGGKGDVNTCGESDQLYENTIIMPISMNIQSGRAGHVEKTNIHLA